jgi:hypothetical protein
LLTTENNDLTRLVAAYFFDLQRHTTTARLKMHWTIRVKIDETIDKISHINHIFLRVHDAAGQFSAHG